jgi:hypothetical protein
LSSANLTLQLLWQRRRGMASIAVDQKGKIMWKKIQQLQNTVFNILLIAENANTDLPMFCPKTPPLLKKDNFVFSAVSLLYVGGAVYGVPQDCLFFCAVSV